MMKLFIFTDLHGNDKIFEKIKKKVKKEKPAAIICGGDITLFGAGTKNWLSKYESLKLPLFLVPGNSPHESIEEVEVYSSRLKFVKNLHLKAISFNSILLIGCGGWSFDGESKKFEKLQKKFGEKIKAFKAKHKKGKVILVFHEPPFKTKLDYLPWAGHVGNEVARSFIEKYKPNLCISGHLHETFNKTDKIKRTKLINPGPEGKIIKI